MAKAWIVAAAELAALVRTKAFVIGIILMPVLMGGMPLLQKVIADRVDITARRFAVIDHSGELFSTLEVKARERAQALASDPSAAAAPFEPSAVEPGARDLEELKLDLSDQVRRGDLFAFIEIPAGLLEAEPGAAASILYHAEQTSYRDLVAWISLVLNEEVRERRYRAAGLQRDLVSRLERPVHVQKLGLSRRDAGGDVQPAEKVDPVRAFVVPMALMALIFLSVMTIAPQLLNSVFEEKMTRISEVLLGCVSTFDLMLGKLIASASAALLIAFLYGGTGLAIAAYLGYPVDLPAGQLLLSIAFLVLAVFLLGSICGALGAAATDLKHTQALMTPVILLMIIPCFTFPAVLQSPAGGLSIAASLLPPAAPFIMPLRLALEPAPPAWQVALSMFLTAAATLACVWAGARIFRIGIFLQGKPPGWLQIIKWIFSG